MTVLNNVMVMKCVNRYPKFVLDAGLHIEIKPQFPTLQTHQITKVYIRRVDTKEELKHQIKRTKNKACNNQT
jgi:hypothetical protein